jgi:hypothetical protein
VKKEMHLKEGPVVKRHRVLIDGESLEEVDFVEEVAGSLGDFSIANQVFSQKFKRTTKAERSANKPIA